MEPATFHSNVAEGPEGGSAYWLTTSDGLRIRLAVWPLAGAKGTVLIFPGRTEYAEKYGRAAADLARRGYASVAIDWRGQGLADRLLPNARLGHVAKFRDYQKDVSAVMAALRDVNVPRPFHLLAHSMGGCIGLRAVMDGLDVETAAFSAPMWGIQIEPHMRPVAWSLSAFLPQVGMGNLRSPGTQNGVYVLDEPFEDNTLTKDPDMWAYMGRQVTQDPRLSLGSPTIVWLREALWEMRTLSQRPAPKMPCICFLGTNERIVDPGRIQTRMDAWPGGELVTFPDAEHETMMEVPAVRNAVFDRAVALFDQSLAKAA
ncbi:MAG: alpha/beta hydrolase [Pseudomonadota bacterium]